jgi:hypothetical protein
MYSLVTETVVKKPRKKILNDEGGEVQKQKDTLQHLPKRTQNNHGKTSVRITALSSAKYSEFLRKLKQFVTHYCRGKR